MSDIIVVVVLATSCSETSEADVFLHASSNISSDRVSVLLRQLVDRADRKHNRRMLHAARPHRIVIGRMRLVKELSCAKSRPSTISCWGKSLPRPGSTNFTSR